MAAEPRQVQSIVCSDVSICDSLCALYRPMRRTAVQASFENLNCKDDDTLMPRVRAADGRTGVGWAAVVEAFQSSLLRAMPDGGGGRRWRVVRPRPVVETTRKDV